MVQNLNYYSCPANWELAWSNFTTAILNSETFDINVRFLTAKYCHRIKNLSINFIT